MEENEFYKKIDRAVVTKATLLDIEMDLCRDSQEFEILHDEYCDLLDNYELFEKTDIDDDTSYPYEKEPEWDKLVFEENGKWGIRESCYSNAVPAIYDSIKCLNETNEYQVWKDQKTGIIWIDGEVHELIRMEYDYIQQISNEQYVVEKDKLKYLIREGEISKEGFENIRIPSLTGWIHVRKNGQWGYLNGNLEFTDDVSYAHAYVIPEDWKYIQKAHDLGLEIHEVTREKISECDNFEQTLNGKPSQSSRWKEYEKKSLGVVHNHQYYKYEKDGKYGVSDFLGLVIIKAEYDDIMIGDEIHKMYQQVYGRKGGKWATLIQSDVIQDKLYFISDGLPEKIFYGDWQKAKVGDKYGIYNLEDGHWCLEPIYDEFIVDDSKKCIITRIGDKYGFFDGGNCIFPEYDRIVLSRCIGFVRVMKDGKKGYIDSNGKWTSDIKEAKLLTIDPMYSFYNHIENNEDDDINN